MAGQTPAMVDGNPALLGHDITDWKRAVRIFSTTTGQLEVGGTSGGISITRDPSNRISSFSIDYVRPDGTITKTRTVTRNASGFITSISSSV